MRSENNKRAGILLRRDRRKKVGLRFSGISRLRENEEKAYFRG
jgi:hypothetical protein